MIRKKLVCVLFLTACKGGTEPIDCTTEARSSITLTVVDAAGDPIADATATYTVDGGPVMDCEDWPDGGFVCGWEVAGEFEVTIEAVGYVTDIFSVTVGADECHVITEVVERTLDIDGA